MKITPNTDLSTLLSSKIPPQKTSNILPKKPLIKPRKISENTPRSSKKPGPPTPLLRWSIHHGAAVNEAENTAECRRKTRREKVGPPSLPHVSARKLAAILWRMKHPNDGGVDGGGGGGGGGDGGGVNKKKESEDELGFKVCFNSLFETSQDLTLNFSKPTIGHGGDLLTCQHASREYGLEAKDPLRSPSSVNGPINGHLCERQSPFRFANYAMEGATKWDPHCSKASNEHPNDLKSLDQKVNAASKSIISSLEKELEQARARIEELELEKRSSKKKIEHFLKKLSEEKAAWQSREHEKVRAIIDEVKDDLNRERKNCQRLKKVNSKLVNELAEVKLSAKRYMQDYEKERKSRALIEEVCDELAKGIGEDKAEVDSLKTECIKVKGEVEEERRMLQMAEVWREERVQMKLVDAKLVLDQKYSQMNYLVLELEKFLKSKGVSLDLNEVKEVEFFRRGSASINIQDIKEFSYDPSNTEDIFEGIEEMVMAENYVRGFQPCEIGTPKTNISNVYDNHSDDMDDDVSGWETVTRDEDQGSSYTPEGSVGSVNMMCRDSNVSGSCCTEISEVCSVSSKNVKKVKSILRFWKTSPTSNSDGYKIITVDGVNRRVSNGSAMSPDCGSNMGRVSPSSRGRWTSPSKKGRIEWPRGVHKGSLKQKLLEARMESQKVQLRMF